MLHLLQALSGISSLKTASQLKDRAPTMMQGKLPLLALGAAAVALFALTRPAAAQPTPAAPGPQPPLPPQQQPIPPFVPGVGLPQPNPAPQAQSNLDVLRAQLAALLTQAALAPQTVDPARLDSLAGELDANGLTAEAAQVRAAAAELRRPRAAPGGPPV